MAHVNRDELVALFSTRIKVAYLDGVSSEGEVSPDIKIPRLLRQFADAIERDLELTRRHSKGYISPRIK